MEKYETYYFTERWQLQISLCMTIFPAFIVDVKTLLFTLWSFYHY